MPKKEGKKTILRCSCGYSQEGTAILNEKVKQKENKVEVVDGEIETLPEIEEECPKCGNRKAYFWTAQTRGGDEPETKFYKCKKCKHIWRSYD